MKQSIKKEIGKIEKILLIAGIITVIIIIIFTIFIIWEIPSLEKIESYCWNVANKLTPPGKDKLLLPTKEEKQQFHGITAITQWFRVESQCERQDWYDNKMLLPK